MYIYIYIYIFSFYFDLSFSLPFLSFSFFMISHSLYLFSLFLSLRLPLSHIKFRVDFGNRCDWIMVVRRTLCLTSVLSFAPCLYSTSHHRLAHQEIFFFFSCSKSTPVCRPACRSYSRIDSV